MLLYKHWEMGELIHLFSFPPACIPSTGNYILVYMSLPSTISQEKIECLFFSWNLRKSLTNGLTKEVWYQLYKILSVRNQSCHSFQWPNYRSAYSCKDSRDESNNIIILKMNLSTTVKCSSKVSYNHFKFIVKTQY